MRNTWVRLSEFVPIFFGPQPIQTGNLDFLESQLMHLRQRAGQALGDFAKNVGAGLRARLPCWLPRGFLNSRGVSQSDALDTATHCQFGNWRYSWLGKPRYASGACARQRNHELFVLNP